MSSETRRSQSVISSVYKFKRHHLNWEWGWEVRLPFESIIRLASIIAHTDIKVSPSECVSFLADQSCDSTMEESQ